jgi:hypothetical protein
MQAIFIRAEWDEEALLKKLHVLIPELPDANGYPDGGEVPFELLSRRFDVANRKAA